MATNVQMYSPRLPISGGAGPFIRLDQPTSDLGGIAGLIAAGLQGWQTGKQQRFENQLKTDLNNAQLDRLKAQTAYAQRPPKTMDPEKELDLLWRRLQFLYKPQFQDPKGRKDPQTGLPLSVSLVDPMTGNALNEKAQAFYDKTMARIAELQGVAGSAVGQLGGLAGAITTGTGTGTQRRVETFDMGGNQFVNGQPTGLAAAINGMGAPTVAPAPARIPPAGGRVNPAAAPGFGAGAGIAGRIMAGQARPTAKYKVGDIVTTGDGRKARIVGFDTDGEPLVEEVR
jgi:hypothetical protein